MSKKEWMAREVIEQEGMLVAEGWKEVLSFDAPESLSSLKTKGQDWFCEFDSELKE